MILNDILDAIGKTPIVKFNHIGAELTKMTDTQVKYIGTPKNGPFKPDGYRY